MSPVRARRMASPCRNNASDGSLYASRGASEPPRVRKCLKPVPDPRKVELMGCVSTPSVATAVKKTKGITHRSNGNGDPIRELLLTTLNKLKIRQRIRSESTTAINEIVDKIFKFMKTRSDHFRELKRLHTGSYYENVKICEPDEFDVMLAIPAQSLDVLHFGPLGAFYRVAIKKNSRRHPLEYFVQEDGITISANKMLKEFRAHVKKSVRDEEDVCVERKKKGSPAVTLLIDTEGLQISLDVVLGLEVHSSWPSFTQSGFQVDNWLGTKAKRDYKFQPFYLVPKYEGNGNVEADGVCAKDAWRISFSHVEKDILMYHGSTRTCCEAVGTKCCRRPCLKLLKLLLQELKKKHPKECAKFCSYHAKTTLFHTCCRRVEDNEWKMVNLSDCFQQFLEDFKKQLRDGQLPNFFVPTHNLLGSKHNKINCEFLADCIESEQNNMFPVFKSY